MFTGIIEAMGTVLSVSDIDGGREIRFQAPRWDREVQLGASIAVDGACLTVEAVLDDGFSARVVPATLSRTVAGDYAPGTRVNLERAALLGASLDGHLVQGHVDGVGTLLSRTEHGGDVRLRFRVPATVWSQTVSQGSICINGVSLTVQSLPGPREVELAIIPFTDEHTNLGLLEDGNSVNVEGDLIAKYVGKMLAPYQISSGVEAEIRDWSKNPGSSQGET